MEVKGLYFSMDAITGLLLISVVSVLIMSTAEISDGVSQETVTFDRYHSQAIDISQLIVKEDFQTINTSYREQLITETSLERKDTTNIAQAIMKLHQNNEPEAEELAENYFQTYRYPTGLYIEGEQVVNIEASSQAVESFLVAGEEEPKRFTVVIGE